jgi:hypothetical protein
MSRDLGNLAMVAGLSCALCFAASADAAEKATTGTVETRIGPIELFMGLPATPEMVQKIYDEMDFQRATQAYIWALPIVAFNEWKLAHEKVFGAQQGDIVVYNNYKDKVGILTANFTTPYLISFANLKDGPIVIDQPAGNYGGAIIDFWQRPITDMGQVGPDKGAGAKYLIVGPGKKFRRSMATWSTNRPRTTSSLPIVLDPGGERVKEALAKWSIYPYSERDNPPAHRSIAPEGVSPGASGSPAAWTTGPVLMTSSSRSR